MKKPFLILISAALAFGSQSCKDKPTIPEYPCVNGKLLGTTCDGRYLIQVDTASQHQIGLVLNFQGDAGISLPGPAAQLRVYNNVISTATPLPPAMRRGQTFYFQYKSVPATSRPCTANVVYYEAPQFDLVATSDVSCSSLLPE
ncbi:hypothetical protein [Hymenobacter algoricola]|uniref:Lipoprotein n=1 Tax=Hymenobacter algoricola TaxID=486267 RepID=A0ABP7NQE8_9BACT